MEKYLDLTKFRYSEKRLLVPCHFVISRFHCIILATFCMETVDVQERKAEAIFFSLFQSLKSIQLKGI